MTGQASSTDGLCETLTEGSPSDGTWSLRWDILREEKPRLAFHAGLPSNGSSVHQTDSGNLVAFDGYLFDRAALGGETNQSDASLIAAYYERWGKALFGRLRGGFALAIWDTRQGHLLVCRDPTGLNPCFYHWDGRVFGLSASLDAILGQPGVDRSFNRALIAEHLRCSWTSHQLDETFYKGVKRLLPAHSLTIEKGRLSVSCYWDPVPPGFSWASREETSQFQSILARAVERCLLAGADSIALSGGFDSISIAAVAADQLRGRDPLHAVSLRFTNSDCDEWETQSAVAKTLGMPQLRRDFADCLDEDSFLEAEMALARRNSCPILSPWQSLYAELLRAAAQRGLRRIMTGSGGDERLMVGRSYGADRLAAFDLPGLWRFFRSYQRSFSASPGRVARVVLWNGAVKPEVRRLLGGLLSHVGPNGENWITSRLYERSRHPQLCPTDAVLEDELRHRWMHPRSIELAPGERSYVRALRDHRFDPFAMIAQDQGESWGRNNGFVVFLPYLDRDLVNLTLRTHPEAMIAGGLSKAPLRCLVAERIPTVTMPARKVNAAQMARETLVPIWDKIWQRIDHPLMLSELGIVDQHKINALMREFFAGRNKELMLAWTLLNTEIWLRARCVDFRGASRE